MRLPLCLLGGLLAVVTPPPVWAADLLDQLAEAEAAVRRDLADKTAGASAAEQLRNAERLQDLADRAWAAHPDRAWAGLELAAKGFQRAGAYRKGLDLLLRVVPRVEATRDQNPTPDAVGRALRLRHRRAELRELLGHLPAALADYQAVGEWGGRAGDAEKGSVADALWSIGRLQMATGEFAAGWDNLKAALAAAERLTPPEPLRVAQVQTCLGLLASELGRDADAGDQLQKAGAYYSALMEDKTQRVSHQQVAEFVLIQVGISKLLRRLGRAQFVEKRLQSLLEKTKPKPKTPSTFVLGGMLESFLRDELGMAKLAQGKATEAADEFRRALDADPDKVRVKWSPTRIHLALLRGVDRGLAGKEFDALAPMLGATVTSLTDGFHYQNDHQRLAVAHARRWLFDASLTMSVRGEVAADAVYQQVLDWKGVVFDRATADRVLANASPADRQRLAALQVPLAGVDWEPHFAAAQAADDQALAEQRRWRAAGEREWATAAANYRRPPLTVAQLAATLPDDAAFVDYVVYHHYGPPTKPARAGDTLFPFERRVLAFVVRKGKPVECIPLPAPAKPVEAAIARCQGEFEQWNDAGTGPAPAWTAAARELADLVWTPVADRLASAARVVLAPDGMLWRVPFAALPGRRAGGYLVEECALAYALSGRHAYTLFHPPPRPPSAAGGTVRGCPDCWRHRVRSARTRRQTAHVDRCGRVGGLGRRPRPRRNTHRAPERGGDEGLAPPGLRRPPEGSPHHRSRAALERRATTPPAGPGQIA